MPAVNYFPLPLSGGGCSTRAADFEGSALLGYGDAAEEPRCKNGLSVIWRSLGDPLRRPATVITEGALEGVNPVPIC